MAGRPGGRVREVPPEPSRGAHPVRNDPNGPEDSGTGEGVQGSDAGTGAHR